MNINFMIEGCHIKIEIDNLSWIIPFILGFLSGGAAAARAFFGVSTMTGALILMVWLIAANDITRGMMILSFFLGAWAYKSWFEFNKWL